MNPFPYAVWLVPCEEQRAELERPIKSLSVRFGTASFAPHATLCSGAWGQGLPALAEMVDRLAAQLTPVEMDTAGISWIECWSGFFFLCLQCKTDLFERASGLIEGSHPPEVGPHLSLLYSFGADGVDRNALRTELVASLPSVIRFDSLEMIRPATGRWEDVASWEMIYAASLPA